MAIDPVLVGYRPGALHAASRLALRVLLVAEKPPADAAQARIEASVRVPLEGPDEQLRGRTREALGSSAPRAVVAVGERGVLGAAAL